MPSSTKVTSLINTSFGYSGMKLELFEINSLKKHIWFDPDLHELDQNRSGTRHNDLHSHQLEWRDICWKQRRLSIQPRDRSSTSRPNKHQKINAAHKGFSLVGYKCTSLSSSQPWGVFGGKTASQWHGCPGGGLYHQVQVWDLGNTTEVKEEVKNYAQRSRIYAPRSAPCDF